MQQIIQEAQNGKGVLLILVDVNGQSSSFYPYDYELDEPGQAQAIASAFLTFLATWLAENRYLPTFDQKAVFQRDDDQEVID